MPIISYKGIGKKGKILAEAIRSHRTAEGAGHEFKRYATITKVDESQRMVWGIATAGGLDDQNEIVEWEATKRAVPEYLNWRNLREMHKDSAVGYVKDLEVDDVKKELLIGAHVVDDNAWKKCIPDENGFRVYNGFSIGGKALARIKEFDAGIGKTISRVKDYKLNEISLVDRPAHPKCVFSLVKRGEDEDDVFSTEDILEKEILAKSQIIRSMERKVLSDEEISELPNTSFALVKRYKDKNGRIHEDRVLPIPDKIHAVSAMQYLDKFGLTTTERRKAHDNIAKVLGSKHDPVTCSFCQKVSKKEVPKLGKNLEQAKAMLARALEQEEEFEITPANPDTVIEDMALDRAEEIVDDESDPRFTEDYDEEYDAGAENSEQAGLANQVDALTSEADESLLDRYDLADVNAVDEEFMGAKVMEIARKLIRSGMSKAQAYAKAAKSVAGKGVAGARTAGKAAGKQGRKMGRAGYWSPKTAAGRRRLATGGAVGGAYAAGRSSEYEGYDPYDDSFLDEFEEEFDQGDFEESESGAPCPYCGTTLKMLFNDMNKSAARCPGCQRIHKKAEGSFTEYDSPAIRKGGGGSADLDDLTEVATDLVDVVANLTKRLNVIEGRPAPRRGNYERVERQEMRKASGIDGDVEKMGPSDADISKAKDITERQSQGKEVTRQETDFRDQVLESKIRSKVG